MARDYKNRVQPKDDAPKRRGHCLFWFLAGVLLGGFAMGLMWLKYDPALIRSAEVLRDKPVPKVDKAHRPPESSSIEFEFPDMLKEMKVFLDDDPEPPAALPPKPKPKVVKAEPPKREPPAATPPKPKPVAKTEHEAYELQLGSFRKVQDAERLKAKLAFLGIQTRIQKVTINGNKTFHRVRSGPYSSQQQMDDVRRVLSRNQVKSIVVRWKG